jgi:hypothetical protein
LIFGLKLEVGAVVLSLDVDWVGESSMSGVVEFLEKPRVFSLDIPVEGCSVDHKDKNFDCCSTDILNHTGLRLIHRPCFSPKFHNHKSP